MAITVKNEPFPSIHPLLSKIILSLSGSFIGLVLLLNLIKNGIQAAKERFDLIYKQLNLNGVPGNVYWLGLLIIDVTLFLISSYLIILVAVICKYEPFANLYAILILIIAFILWGVSSHLFEYSISLLFKQLKSALSVIPIVNLCPFILGLVVNILILYSSSNDLSLMDSLYNKNAMYFNIIYILLFPPYGIVEIMNSLNTLKLLNIIDDSQYPINFSNYLSFNKGISGLLLVLLSSCILYSFVLYMFNQRINCARINDSMIPELLSERNYEYIKTHEKDVLDEFESVQKNPEKNPISLVNIIKEFEYKTEKNIPVNNEWNYGEPHYSLKTKIGSPRKLVKTVIEDVTFHVNSNECFGLLGPNGAGKSTILNMLTGIHSPTMGNLYYNGKKVEKMTDLQLGYCNQNDILWKELTLREHLEFFLKLKGYPKEKTKECATEYINYFDLTEHQNKKVEQLSGGTKRKLSVLLAICGYPKYIILDEPTCGMDPYSKRFIWNIIQDIKTKMSSSIILTTHSMEEAEILCDRLTILLDGRLKCIGSPEFLTMTYATNYIVEVESDQLDEVHHDLFEKGKINTEYKQEKITNNQVKYYIKNNIDIGKLFELLEKDKKDKKIKNYVISESSLEDVFLNFVTESDYHSKTLNEE